MIRWALSAAGSVGCERDSREDTTDASGRVTPREAVGSVIGFDRVAKREGDRAGGGDGANGVVDPCVVDPCVVSGRLGTVRLGTVRFGRGRLASGRLGAVRLGAVRLGSR